MTTEEKKKYEWQPGMREISGLGGAYEDACRQMVLQGMEWLDAHPDAKPDFHGYKNVYGIIVEDNDDAKALSKAVCEGVDPSGAMHQATIGACLYIREKGWDAYVALLSKESVS